MEIGMDNIHSIKQAITDEILFIYYKESILWYAHQTNVLTFCKLENLKSNSYFTNEVIKIVADCCNKDHCSRD